MNKILQLLKSSKRAAFSTKEYSALAGKKGYARLALHRAFVKGEIQKVKNGWWTFPDSIPEAVACEVSKPGYISFHSALALHGLTTQTPNIIQVAILKVKKNYPVFGIPVRQYKVNSLSDFSLRDGVLLASPERAVADSITHPRSCPDIVLLEAIGNISQDLVFSMLTSSAAKKRFARLLKYARQDKTR